MTYKDWKKSMVDGDTKDLMSSPNSKVDLRAAKPIKHTPEELRELEVYANERDIQVYEMKNFDGDSEIFKEQVDVLHSLKKEYGYTDKLTIGFDDLGTEDLAQTPPNGNIIVFNLRALRDRTITNNFLNSDNYLSSTNLKGIASHEMGHKLSKKFGNRGLDIAQRAYYNVFGERISKTDTLEYLRNNVSIYSIRRNYETIDKPLKVKYFKEIIPEVLGKDMTNPDKFSNEFIKILKEVWNI